MRPFFRRLLSFAVLCLWSSSLLAGNLFFEPASEPGWTPPDGAEQDVLDKLHSVIGELDEGRYEQAYWNLDPDLQATLSQDLFVAFQGRDREQVGPMTALRILRITWMKARAGSGFNGIYATIDLARTFQRARRDCGYVVLHQHPDSADWAVLRLDDHLMPDAVYDDMVRKGKGHAAEELWNQLKRGCPNFH